MTYEGKVYSLIDPYGLLRVYTARLNALAPTQALRAES